MGLYKVYYINREGHTETTEFHARNGAEAKRHARHHFDDIIKVKRVSGVSMGWVLPILLGAATLALLVLLIRYVNR